MANSIRTLVLIFWCHTAMAVAPIPEEDLARAAEIRDAALTSELAFDILESLTTEVGPRMAGTEGDARAVAWAERKFLELGFDKVTLQPVTFPVWKRGEETAEVVSPFPQPLIITALGNSPSTPDGGLKAPIRHFATLEALEAQPDDSLDGGIVFISNRMERFKNGSGYGPAVQARSRGAQVAAAKGAEAILIRSVGTDNDRLPHTGVMRSLVNIPNVPAAAVSNPDADLLVSMLKRTDEVVVHLKLGSILSGETYTSHNVIGDIIGSEKPEEYVVIGGHLDSWDLGTGAIDDGAGCAITMAAGKLIQEMGTPKRTIRVILWANEEQGLHGARAYHAANAANMKNHILGSESDFGAGRIYQFDTRVKPEALGVVDQMMQVLAPLGITRGHNKGNGGPDLIPMHNAGMAVARLLQDGTDYFDYHHTANDTLDKVDPESLKQNVAAWVVFAYLAAQAPDDFGFGLGLQE